MPYVFLGAAILCEIVATSLLKASDGFSKLWPTIACIAGYLLSFVLLAQTLKQVPVSIAYAIWSGVGTALIAAVGMIFLGEPVSLAKIGGVVLVVGGVVLLSLAGAH
ncbi:MAG: multidrug efflux SMR transporter [Actinocatenispora sp.]